MTLIEKIMVNKSSVSFYNGIDFDLIMKHAKDGTDGFIFCFIKNWADEVKSWERNCKINSVLTNEFIKKFKSKDIENDFVSIYQLDGIEIKVLLEIIKEKIVNKNLLNQTYIHDGDLDKGAWKIVKTRLSN
jgi:hypothetical protein